MKIIKVVRSADARKEGGITGVPYAVIFKAMTKDGAKSAERTEYFRANSEKELLKMAEGYAQKYEKELNKRLEDWERSRGRKASNISPYRVSFTVINKSH